MAGGEQLYGRRSEVIWLSCAVIWPRSIVIFQENATKIVAYLSLLYCCTHFARTKITKKSGLPKLLHWSHALHLDQDQVTDEQRFLLKYLWYTMSSYTEDRVKYSQSQFPDNLSSVKCWNDIIFFHPSSLHLPEHVLSCIKSSVHLNV